MKMSNYKTKKDMVKKTSLKNKVYAPKVKMPYVEKKYQLFGGSTSLYKADEADGSFRECVSLCAQGDDVTNRDGKRNVHRSMHVKVAIRPDEANTVSFHPDWGFWSLVLDKQPNGTLALFSDIYSGGGLGSGFGMTRFQINAGRFKVLACEDWFIGGKGTSTANSDAPTPYYCNRYIDLTKALKSNEQVQYWNGTAGTTADVSTNSLIFILAQGNAANGLATQQVACNYLLKYSFTD